MKIFKRKINNEYGITLISLVVTIIVLLILVGISVKSIIGNTGLIQQSKQAVVLHAEAANEEKNNMNNLMSEITKYKTNRIKYYTISYNSNGGTEPPESQTKTSGVPLKISSDQPTKYGYTFEGWSSAPNGSVEYQSEANFLEDNDITLYAVWKEGYKYDGQYNFNGSNYIDTGVRLFSRENASKNFEIIFTVNNMEDWYVESDDSIANIFNSMKEVGKYPGITFRRSWWPGHRPSDGSYNFDGNGNSGNLINYFTPYENNANFSFIRINSVVYYKKNNSAYITLCDLTGFSSYIDTPVTFGCSFNSSDQPFRFMKGNLSNMRVILGDDVKASDYDI